jgi:hypothetical protein
MEGRGLGRAARGEELEATAPCGAWRERGNRPGGQRVIEVVGGGGPVSSKARRVGCALRSAAGPAASSQPKVNSNFSIYSKIFKHV